MLLQAEEVKEEEEEEEEEIIELTGKDLKKRVEYLSATLTVHVWRYMARGLFDAHKLIVASMLAFRHLSQPSTSCVKNCVAFCLSSRNRYVSSLSLFQMRLKVLGNV